MSNSFHFIVCLLLFQYNQLYQVGIKKNGSFFRSRSPKGKFLNQWCIVHFIAESSPRALLMVDLKLKEHNHMLIHFSFKKDL